jgi:hypothetical protein
MSDDDRDLRDRFAHLRAEDRAGVPAFRAPSAAARWSWSPRLVVAAAIVLIALVLARPDATPPRLAHEVDLGAAAWRSPTDFLLVTPGRELLRSVPTLGSPETLAPIDLRGRSSAPESTQS